MTYFVFWHPGWMREWERAIEKPCQTWKTLNKTKQMCWCVIMKQDKLRWYSRLTDYQDSTWPKMIFFQFRFWLYFNNSRFCCDICFRRMQWQKTNKWKCGNKSSLWLTFNDDELFHHRIFPSILKLHEHIKHFSCCHWQWRFSFCHCLRNSNKITNMIVFVK